ncbi:MAG: serine/threonine-protein kinase [Myxococcota bacterium]
MRELEAGDVVAGRFTIREVIGLGGMGTVFRALQTSLEREVALKVIHPGSSKKRHTRDRFLREAHLLATLRHAGVVEVYDFGEHEGTLFLAMELLRGSTLRQIVDEDLPRLPLDLVLHIGVAMADVLVATAGMGLVHRDLKPENVMLEGDPARPRVVLVDFGLAFAQESLDDRLRRLTREGVVTGTPDYMSPEQARGASEVTPGSDVYSFGVMLYEMLTSEVPFHGDLPTLLARHLFARPPHLRDAKPPVDAPGALDDLLQRMLAKEPERRPTPTQVRDTLMALDPSAESRMSPTSSGSQTVGRAARMLSAPPTMPAAPAAVATTQRIAWIGDASAEADLAVAAHGFELVPLGDDGSGPLPPADAVFVANASIDLVRALVRPGRPLIADAERGDIERLRGLVQAGAAEVVMRPVDAADVARKAARALRKGR